VVVKILKYEFLIFEVARILMWPGYLPITLRRITRFTSLRDLRLELILSPIIANIRHKRVLNNNPYTNNTSLPLKI
jgi:hypothetical protein